MAAEADDNDDIRPRAALAKVIPRRPRVAWWLGLVFALAFAILVMPTITADRWLGALGAGQIRDQHRAALTIRVPALSGYNTDAGHIGQGGIVIARGAIANATDEANARAVAKATPRGALPYVAFFLLTFVIGAIFTHHMQRSTRGRLVRVQVVSLISVAVLAIVVKVMLLMSALSVLVVPVALLSLVATMALDRIVGLATGILAALVVALLGPFDVGVAILMLVQAAVAGLVVPEQPKDRWRAALAAGAVTTVFTAATYVLLTYLTTGQLPALHDPLSSPLVAAALGPALATLLSVPLLPLYQVLVGEITRGQLVELEDLSNPLLRQIAERAPGTWQHSLMMANMAEIAANAIGASGRLVRVGAYYHDLGKSLQPKYFIENLEPGETSPHDQLRPEVSCDAIFAHVTEGIVTARKAGLHERIVDFMHMHHGNGVLEYFWGKTKEQGNPRALSVEDFRYPGHPPQSRETAILAICDAVEAASRTLKKPEAAAIDALVQRIVYGKLHLGQLDESGLSMSDLRRVSDSLRETIRHANHGRIEYQWQKAQQDASAGMYSVESLTATGPRLDSLDRPARRESVIKAVPELSDSSRTSAPKITGDAALAQTADIRSKAPEDLAMVSTAPALVKEVQPARTTGAHRIVELGDADGRPSAASTPPASTPGGERSRARSPSSTDVWARADGAGSQPSHGEHADRARAPSHLPFGPAPERITPATFGEPAPAARKRAATLPPTPLRRAPTVPPLAAPGRRAPTIQPPESRTSGPPLPVDLENAVTNPPPLRGRPSNAPPALLIDDDNPGATEPSMPRFDLPLKAPPSSSPGITPPPAHGSPEWSKGLAARIDAALDDPGDDPWSMDTPVRAPSKAELRALLGQPDPTRQQSLDELEALHRRAVEASDTSLPVLQERRHPYPTAEVDPDDIESAIEIAPPARRAPSAIAVAKPPKKSE
jgi:hypothetical protein